MGSQLKISRNQLHYYYRLISLRGSQNLQVAVLHPRSLSVYALKTKEGITDHGKS